MGAGLRVPEKRQYTHQASVVQQPPLRCTGPCSQAPPQGARQCDCTYPTWCWNLRPTWGRNTEIWVCWGPLMHMLKHNKGDFTRPRPERMLPATEEPCTGGQIFLSPSEECRGRGYPLSYFFFKLYEVEAWAFSLFHTNTHTQTHTHAHTQRVTSVSDACSCYQGHS